MYKLEKKTKKTSAKPWTCWNCNSKITREELQKRDYTCLECGATVFVRK